AGQRQVGTVTGHREGRRPVPVRAPRLLLRRQRFSPQQARVQSRRDASRHMGEDRKEEKVIRESIMEKITVSAARQTDAVGKHVILRAWVRTRRDSKGGFSFIELNDGSCQGNVQVVAPGELANYDSV